jgi:Protein of unknown function (DUF3551)
MHGGKSLVQPQSHVPAADRGIAAASRHAQNSRVIFMTLEVIMRRMILIVPTVITLLISVEPVNAQNYPWCQQRGDGTTNCGFVTYEQCMAKQGSWCYRNPMYQPSAGEPWSRRTPRGSQR